MQFHRCVIFAVKKIDLCSISLITFQQTQKVPSTRLIFKPINLPFNSYPPPPEKKKKHARTPRRRKIQQIQENMRYAPRPRPQRNDPILIPHFIRSMVPHLFSIFTLMDHVDHYFPFHGPIANCYE